MLVRGDGSGGGERGKPVGLLDQITFTKFGKVHPKGK